MKMWGEEKPTWRRDINKKAAQVQLEDWTKKKQPMEVPHGHLEECPKNKQLAGVTLDQLLVEDWSTRSVKKNMSTLDQLEDWSTRSLKKNMSTTAVVQGQLEDWTRRSTAHDQQVDWSRRRSAINELASGVKMNYPARPR